MAPPERRETRGSCARTACVVRRALRARVRLHGVGAVRCVRSGGQNRPFRPLPPSPRSSSTPARCCWRSSGRPRAVRAAAADARRDPRALLRAGDAADDVRRRRVLGLRRLLRFRRVLRRVVPSVAIGQPRRASPTRCRVRRGAYAWYACRSADYWTLPTPDEPFRHLLASALAAMRRSTPVGSRLLAAAVCGLLCSRLEPELITRASVAITVDLLCSSDTNFGDTRGHGCVSTTSVCTRPRQRS